MKYTQKICSFILCLSIVASCCAPAFAVDTESNSAEIPKGLVLIDTETALVDDGEGNQIEVIIEEYATPSSGSTITPFGLNKEYPVGTNRSFVFRITNNQLGLPSLAVGIPLTSAMKNTIAKVVKEKLGEKLASQFVPGLNIASWVLAAIATANSIAGNTGFQVTVNCTYKEHYLQREGYYMYGWDITSCSFGIY